MSQVRHVLVVDGDEAIRASIRRLLEGLGYRVSVAAGGPEGLAAFRRDRADLVITGLRGLQPDGTALVAALKDASPDTPVIVVSSAGDLREAMGAVQAGAWDVILEPIVDAGQLALAIGRAQERAGLIEEIRSCRANLETQVAARTRDLADRERAQRQERLGRIASGIAHDLNNVLAPIMMAGDLLQEADLKHGQRAYVEMIRASAVRGADLVKQLLLYSRGADGPRTLIAPGDVVRDAVRIVSETFPKNIEVRLDTPAEGWPIEADPAQLHQVMLNLCANARDAMPGGGTLALAVEQIHLDEGSAPSAAAARGGPYVVITVVDTGTGIPAAILHQIFDPFFTTKPQGQGTGLGLSAVQGIVDGHRGFIDVRSECGRGTEFRIYLPAKPGIPPPAEAAGPQDVARGSGETILVVDDEKPVRDMIQRTLHANGYRVLVADSGPEALDLYGRTPGIIDLVLMDFWMPYMDGLATIRQIALRDPGARIIAMSGLADTREKALTASPVVKRFLGKPWKSGELLSAIRDVLAAPANGSGM